MAASPERFRTYPFQDGLEAFFGAVLVKPRV